MTRIPPIALLLAAFLVVPAPAHAGEKTITVEVKGLVCSFCATGLTRLFSREKGVSKVDVSLEKSAVELRVDDANGPDDARIKAVVEDAGFEFGGVKR